MNAGTDDGESIGMRIDDSNKDNEMEMQTVQ